MTGEKKWVPPYIGEFHPASDHVSGWEPLPRMKPDGFNICFKSAFDGELEDAKTLYRSILGEAGIQRATVSLKLPLASFEEIKDKIK